MEPISDRNGTTPAYKVGEGFAFLAAIILCGIIATLIGYLWGAENERMMDQSTVRVQSPNYRSKLYCDELTGIQLERCQLEQTVAAIQAQNSELDLSAQRNMAIWSLAMFITGAFSAGLTLWALIYVRGTLIATQEALVDTGLATKAMLEGNIIASHAQRPWIDIDAKLIDFSFLNHRVFRVDWVVDFTNTGHMLAESFNCNVRAVKFRSDFLEQMGFWYDRFAREDQGRDSVLVPNQRAVFAGQINQSIEDLPWETEPGLRKDCTLMILAMAAYNIPGDNVRRYAMKGFSVGENRSVIDNRRLIYDTISDLSLDKLNIQPMGRSRAN